MTHLVDDECLESLGVGRPVGEQALVRAGARTVLGVQHGVVDAERLVVRNDVGYRRVVVDGVGRVEREHGAHVGQREEALVGHVHAAQVLLVLEGQERRHHELQVQLELRRRKVEAGHDVARKLVGAQFARGRVQIRFAPRARSKKLLAKNIDTTRMHLHSTMHKNKKRREEKERN